MRYVGLNDDQTFVAALRSAIVEFEPERVRYFASEDQTPCAEVERIASALRCRSVRCRSPMFLLGEGEVDDYFHRARKPRMAGFYREQR